MKGITVLIFICTSVCSFGQDFGLKAGVNFNSIHGTNPLLYGNFKPSGSVGFHAGVFFGIKLGDRFSCTPELQYSRRGHHFGEVRHDLNYLEMPVMLSYSIKKFSIDAGPTFGWRLSAASKFNGSSSNLNYLYDKEFDFSVAAGAKFSITKALSVVARYYFGITSILSAPLRDENNVTIGEIDHYSRTAQIGVAYKLKNFGN